MKNYVSGFRFLTAREFIHYNADVMREKVVVIIDSKQFMAMLSDESQTKKPRQLLAQVGKNGIPVHFVVTLLKMEEFGCTDAVSLKKGLDPIFESGNVPFSD